MSDDGNPAAAEDATAPLAESEWQRLRQLIGLSEARQIAPDQHAELTGLHAQATAYADAWKADPEAAFGHLVATVDALCRFANGIASAMPGAGGFSLFLRNAFASMDRAKQAIEPPPAPPELPPPPDETEAGPPSNPTTGPALDEDETDATIPVPADPPPSKRTSPAAAAAAAAKPA